MQLKNASGTFNFLSSLIQYEGAWTNRSVYGLPYVEDEPEQPGHRGGILSVILHELTHLASFHTTRLGWITHESAARLLKQWLHSESPVFSGTTAQIVGTMTPVLEGLATYAQLDLDADDSPLTLYSAPTFYARAAASGSAVPTSATLRDARLSQVESLENDGEGLLHLLYQDSESSVAEQNLYLVGYLWVKAAAASLARRCPPLAPADVMLPLLIRILCDHPALLQAHRGEIGVDKLLPTIHRSIVQWSAASLDQLAALLRDEAKRDRFDHLHVADFLDSGGDVDSYVVDTYPAFVSSLVDFDDEIWRCYAVVNTSASFHFTSRSRGTVLSADVENHRIVLDNSGTEVTIVTAPIENLWSLGARHGADTERLDRTRGQALGREDSVFKLAAEATASVTIAKFFGLSSPHDSGIVLWDEESRRWAYLSFIPEALDSVEHNNRLQIALSFTIEQRLSFARAIVVGDDFKGTTTAAVETLLEALVSAPHKRSKVIQHGFANALPMDTRAELSKWSQVNVLELPHLPSEELLRGVGTVVDLVGFAGKADGKGVVVGDLFPTIR